MTTPLDSVITVISGSRRIKDPGVVARAVLASGFTITKVIEGGQRTRKGGVIVGGVDYFARLWAEENNVPCETYEARWDELRRQAGPERNERMAKDARQLIAVPDWRSTGTADMLRQAERFGLKIYVHHYPDLEQKSQKRLHVEAYLLALWLNQGRNLGEVNSHKLAAGAAKEKVRLPKNEQDEVDAWLDKTYRVRLSKTELTVDTLPGLFDDEKIMRVE